LRLAATGRWRDGDDQMSVTAIGTARAWAGPVHGVRGPRPAVATVGVVLHPEAAEIRGLYVRRSWRGRGLGRALAGHAMDRGGAAGRPRVLLWSDTRFEAAHGLYAALGFRRTGSRRRHDRNRSREYRYERAL